jgi:hypothetical protein
LDRIGRSAGDHVTAPAVRRPTDMPLLVFTAVVLLLALSQPVFRDWLWTKFSDMSLNTLGWLGADIGPLTN